MKKLFSGFILIIGIQSSYAQDTLWLKTGQKGIGKLKSIEGPIFVLKVGDSTLAYERNEIEAFHLCTSIQMKNDVTNDIKKKTDKKKNKKVLN
ncbi:MAG: hypothetical protein ABI761_15205 [Saprospiraceae bacterium]